MESCLAQVLQKDMGRRLQVGQEIIDYFLDEEKSHDLEQDQTALDKMVDGIGSSWINSSNFKVGLLNEAVSGGGPASHSCPPPPPTQDDAFSVTICILFEAKSLPSATSVHLSLSRDSANVE